MSISKFYLYTYAFFRIILTKKIGLLTIYWHFWRLINSNYKI